MSGHGSGTKKIPNKRGGRGGHDRPAPMRRDAPVTGTVQASSKASVVTNKASNRKSDHISTGSTPSSTTSNKI